MTAPRGSGQIWAMSKIEDVRSDSRERARAYSGNMLTGFVASAVAVGALGPQGKGKLPERLGPMSFDLGSGALALWWSRKGMTRKHAWAAGYGFQALAGGLRELGAQMSSRY